MKNSTIAALLVASFGTGGVLGAVPWMWLEKRVSDTAERCVGLLEGTRLQRDHCAEMLDESTDWKIEFQEPGITIFYKDGAVKYTEEDTGI